MQRADAKYVELKGSGQWGKKDSNTQIVALTAASQNTSNSKKTQGAASTSKADKSTVPKWKFDHSLSMTNTYKRNEKKNKWCDGPGHGGISMWVLHDPGTCTTKGKDKQSSTTIDEKTLTASFKGKGLSEDETESKVQAILAVMNS